MHLASGCCLISQKKRRIKKSPKQEVYLDRCAHLSTAIIPRPLTGSHGGEVPDLQALGRNVTLDSPGHCFDSLVPWADLFELLAPKNARTLAMLLLRVNIPWSEVPEAIVT